jgi:hypothetical protein
VRDALLEWIGFNAIEYDQAEQNCVNTASPKNVRAAILVQMVKIHGRPVVYILPEIGNELPAEGTWVDVDASLLDRTLNFRLLSEGQAYYTAYTSTPVNHCRYLRAVNEEACLVELGVWSQDATHELAPADQPSIGPRGQLILPKLFRRCTDYYELRARDSPASSSTGYLPVPQFPHATRTTECSWGYYRGVSRRPASTA